MLKTHIILAFRHLRKERGYTLSSIFGLAVAFTASFFALSFVLHEYSADSHFADPATTFRLKSNDAIDSPVRFPVLPVSNAQYMEDHFPEVDLGIPVYQEGGETEITVGGRLFIETQWAYTEPEVTKLFLPEYFEVTNAFEEGTVLLSQSLAHKLYGDIDPAGNFLTLEEGSYTVAGVFKDFPSNAHLVVNALAVPLPSKVMKFAQGLVYVRLKPGVDVALLNEKVHTESEKMERFIDVIRYTLANVQNTYLEGTSEGGILKKANKEMITLVSTISLIILFIACFNIINLTQVKTLFRGREMGVKKVLGITRPQMFVQFLVESVMLVSMAALLSVSAIQLLSGTVADYLHVHSFGAGVAACLLTLLVLGVAGVLALMQNMLFNRVTAREVMAGNFKVGERKWLLKGLVGLQFLIACTLFGGALLVDKQMTYIMQKPLGFEIDNLWYLASPDGKQDLRLLKTELQSVPEVENSTISSGLPFVGTGAILIENEGEMAFVPFVEIDKNFVSTLQVPYLSTPAFLPDSGLLVNERVLARTDLDIEKKMGKKIVGELTDFHFSSLNSPIEVIALSLTDPSSGYLTMRIRPENKKAATFAVEKAWESLYPARQFELLSLKDQYFKKHQQAYELSVVLRSLSFVAVFISCVGLASLTGFFVKKRFKEIAIRKVLGASVGQVVGLVNTGYVTVIGAVVIVSAGCTYHLGTHWLSGFAYATTFDVLIVAIPGLTLFIVSSAIMISQTWATARANPVDALRTE